MILDQNNQGLNLGQEVTSEEKSLCGQEPGSQARAGDVQRRNIIKGSKERNECQVTQST